MSAPTSGMRAGAIRAARVARASCALAAAVVVGCADDRAPAARDVAARDSAAGRVDGAQAPVLSPEAALRTLRLPPGYRAELVAAEPLVQDPVAIDFDPDGRMYVVEMRGYMPNIRGEGEELPIGRVVVVEDADGDGTMDRTTVFADGLVLPRAVKVLERGVLVGAPPDLLLLRDTTGDGRADTRVRVRDDYGTRESNPEHNANGLLWGIDNWIHNANYAGQLRVRPGRDVEYRRTPSLGQWGVSSDEVGRLYRNFNEDPLHADLVSSHYAARAGDRAMRGVYEALTPNVPVWPGRPTPAVNRGYRPQTLRADSTLAHYTSAGSPTAFVGDRLPAELRRSVFVTEPAGNLVGRFVVAEGADGMPVARRAEERTEFLVSTDERFRPVNLATAPDGTLYVVDMYRGIIQHRAYITGYLEQKIIERGLEGPVGLGRIYRIVHESAPPRGAAERPRLSAATPAQLVGHLAHPNGWWRITAQRLLVERGAREAAPALRALARGAADERARLHALWTLDGLGEADAATVTAAFGDASPHVRAAAVRIGEPWLARSDLAPPAVAAAALRLLDDGAPPVRRQLAASLGELPAPRRDSALAAVVARHGADPVVADLVASALVGREAAFLERVLAARDAAARAPAVAALAAGVMRGRRAADVQRLLGWAGDTARPRWQRLALMDGASPRGGRGGAAGGAAPLALSARPTGLLATAAGGDSALAAPARRLLDAVRWPGKAVAARPAAPRLTPEEERRVAAGRQQYVATCAGCHGADGAGQANVAASLVGSPWVTGDPARLVRIVLHGKEGRMLMPPVGGALTDAQVAAVLTYVRRAWGHEASPVAPAAVAEVRGATTGRRRPWSEAELQRIGR